MDKNPSVQRRAMGAAVSPKSEAGKGPDPRPVDPAKWHAGWAKLQVQCPRCQRYMMRRRGERKVCIWCGNVWHEEEKP